MCVSSMYQYTGSCRDVTVEWTFRGGKVTFVLVAVMTPCFRVSKLLYISGEVVET